GSGNSIGLRTPPAVRMATSRPSASLIQHTPLSDEPCVDDQPHSTKRPGSAISSSRNSIGLRSMCYSCYQMLYSIAWPGHKVQCCGPATEKSSRVGHSPSNPARRALLRHALDRENLELRVLFADLPCVPVGRRAKRRDGTVHAIKRDHRRPF